MPKPKKNESKQDFLNRCTKEVMGEGKESDQAYAMCNAYWSDAKSQRQALTLTAPFELVKAEGEEEAKKFMVTAYTGKLIDLGWYGKLIFDVDGMSAKEKFPVLREHERDRVVGIGAKAWNDGKNFFIGGDFMTSTRDGREVRDLATQGFPWQASVGIWPVKVKVLKDDKETITVNGEEVRGPVEVWLKSKVGEVSFVSLGADDDTAAIALSDQAVNVSIERGATTSSTYSLKIENEPKEDEKMEMNIELLEKEAPELLTQIRQSARDEGVKIERERVTAVLEAGADPAVTLQVIKDGVSAEGAFKLFYAAEKAKRATALKELQTQAPQPVGQTAPKETPPPADPKKELMDKALKLAREKKISVAEAMKQIQAESPDLISANLPKMHEVVND